MKQSQPTGPLCAVKKVRFDMLLSIMNMSEKGKAKTRLLRKQMKHLPGVNAFLLYNALRPVIFSQNQKGAVLKHLMQ
ncbi:hypothetical protein DFQ00_101219 [Paenibacillus barcinonensis]|uniref:Uncharacterized protein n=1 Tax=Paenibacillus barcinonensis TaxID=198119 RepID=A0A2V4VEW9_PAEBA|nr:hypothetical protein DFQ00_101219 [Paenibacillus barcinonensis]